MQTDLEGDYQAVSVAEYKRAVAVASTPAQVMNCLQGMLPFVAADHAQREELVGLTVARLESFDVEGGTRGSVVVTEVAA